MSRFDALADRLLREGVAYRHVHRLIGELKDHHEDARCAELRAGAREADADTAAWVRLGDPTQLAESILARSELRALSARYPRLWGSAMPIAAWMGVLVSIAFAVCGAISILSDLGFSLAGSGPLLAPFQAAVDAFIFVMMRALPTVIGGAVLILAVRQRVALAWPAAGAILVTLIAGTTDMTVIFSITHDAQSEMSVYTSLLPVFFAPFTNALGAINVEDLRGGLASSAVMALVAFAPLLARRRLMQPPA